MTTDAATTTNCGFHAFAKRVLRSWRRTQLIKEPQNHEKQTDGPFRAATGDLRHSNLGENNRRSPVHDGVARLTPTGPAAPKPAPIHIAEALRREGGSRAHHAAPFHSPP